MITDELLFRFLSRETSEKENRTIRDWLSGNPDQVNRLAHLKEIFESADQTTTREEILNNWHTVESKLEVKHSPYPIRTTLTVRLARAAAVFIILAGSGLLFYHQINTHVIRNKDLIAKSVLLPDGSHVDLGPGSKLVYGDEFLKGTRVIRMTGEAYFDVTTDRDHPFIVIAGQAKIKVTGTKFIVNASPGSKEVEVTVKSGVVLFYNSDTMDEHSFRMGLIAGERGIFYPALNRMDKTRDSYSQSTP